MCAEVIIDLLCAQPAGNSKFHGGGEYTKTVFRALAEKYNGEYCLTVCYDTEQFLDNWVLKLIKGKNIQAQRVKTASDIADYIRERSKYGDVRFFAGMIYAYDCAQFPDNAVCIGTCHGLRVLEKPYDRYAPYYVKSRTEFKEMVKMLAFKERTVRKSQSKYKDAINNFDIVITVSKHSAFSLQVNYPQLMDKKRIYVFYTPEKYVPPLEFEENVNGNRYILMISANRWVKNSFRGIIALDGLYQKGLLKGIKTKVFGNLPARIKDRVKCKECFEYFGYVSPEDLERAYRDCDVFFYPTLNEGFGLPPMEAMKYGKTCAISAVCSLTEVYGNAVYYFNPYDIGEMQNRILMALNQPISEELVLKRVMEITKKQDEDLKELCKLIVHSSNQS